MIARLIRTVALVWAVATATLPGLLAVAEGAGDAAASTAVAAHVEAAGGSEACPVAHEAHCAACTMLRHGHTGPCAPRTPWELSSRAQPAALALVPAVDGRFHSSGNPRAPPAA
ncbi:MAG: hypothetical protein H0X64_02810 [Gemmatimonadaceae bacterium]|nr:hypothetical protein [Gemmatimonadaceae bacterium]